MIETQDATLTDLTRALVERFAPDRIVLFGSRARGDHRPDSDYDLLIVVGGPSAPSEDVVRRALRDVHRNVEVVVDTRERFERRRTDVGTLEYAADREGRILHARGTPPEPRQVRETPGRTPESLQEWIERAKSDITMMELALARSDNVRDGVVFHAHQGVEKLLKAVLVSANVPPPRTHDLTELVTRLPANVRDLPGIVEACAGLQGLWPSARYPNRPMPTSEQMQAAVRWARIAKEILSPVLTLPNV